MNRHIYNTNMYLFLIIIAVRINSIQSFYYHFSSFVTFVFKLHTNPANKVAHVTPRLHMLNVRLCVCRTYYINMDTLE